MLLLDCALILVLARALGALASRWGQPAVIGEIVAGILVGPTFFHGALTDRLFPADVRPLLGALANIGVALFMFLVGTELDPGVLGGARRTTVTVSLGSMAIPFGLGSLLALYLVRHHPHTEGLGFALFMGAAMSVTAFPVLARILSDRGMHRTLVGGLALSCAALSDVLAWSLLASIVAFVGGSGHHAWLVLLVVPFAGLCLLVVRPLLEQVASARPELAASAMPAVGLAGLLLSGAFTEWIGLHFIFGAFLFGTTIPRSSDGALRRSLRQRVEGVSVLLLLPVYFVVAGMKVDLSEIGLTGLGDLGLIMLVAVGGKFGGTFLAARLHRVELRQSAALATLMNARGLTELVILTVGIQLGVLTPDLYSLMVVMALLTTAMTGPLLRVLYPPERVRADTVAPATVQTLHVK